MGDEITLPMIVNSPRINYVIAAVRLCANPTVVSAICDNWFNNSLDGSIAVGDSIKRLVDYILLSRVSLVFHSPKPFKGEMEMNVIYRSCTDNIIYLLDENPIYAIPMSVFYSFDDGIGVCDSLSKMLSHTEKFPGIPETQCHFRMCRCPSDANFISYSGYLGDNELQMQFHYDMYILTIMVIFLRILVDLDMRIQDNRRELKRAFGVLLSPTTTETYPVEICEELPLVFLRDVFERFYAETITLSQLYEDVAACRKNVAEGIIDGMAALDFTMENDM